MKLFRPVILKLALVLPFYLGGCATTEEFVATGGSRADGTVNLAYEYGMFQSPREDSDQGVTLAASTCAGWGYSGSQPFGGETSRCIGTDGNGSCVQWSVTRNYQCLGSPGAIKASN